MDSVWARNVATSEALSGRCSHSLWKWITYFDVRYKTYLYSEFWQMEKRERERESFSVEKCMQDVWGHNNSVRYVFGHWWWVSEKPYEILCEPFQMNKVQFQKDFHSVEIELNVVLCYVMVLVITIICIIITYGSNNGNVNPVSLAYDWNGQKSGKITLLILVGQMV